MKTATPPIERVMRRVVVTPGPLTTDCWICTLAPNGAGYVTVVLPSRRGLYAHRVTYEHHVGPIPEGLQIDHLCRVRNCCNPTHLEAVTSKENNARGMSPPAVAGRTGHCKYGHSLDDAYVRRLGRSCRTCAWYRNNHLPIAVP